MTTAKGKQLLDFFIKEAVNHGDPFFLCHFSRVEDQYRAYHEGLDQMDAMLIIKGLVAHFNINELLLSTALPTAGPKTENRLLDIQSPLEALLADIAHHPDIEKLEALLPEGLGAKLNQLRSMARVAEQELELTHACISDLYQETYSPVIKDCLRQIAALHTEGGTTPGDKKSVRAGLADQITRGWDLVAQYRAKGKAGAIDATMLGMVLYNAERKLNKGDEAEMRKEYEELKTLTAPQGE